MTTQQSRSPVIFLSHGAPPLADDPVWTRELADLAAGMARPKAILVVSAHWERAPLTIGSTRTVPLLYDFWGFPDRYYQVEYAAPGAPQLADRVRRLLGGREEAVIDEPERGLDHGAYVPLVEMYPEADIPVLQISMPTVDPAFLLDVGRRLAPLRDEGVLIIGSGFSTHNLREMDPTNSHVPFWSSEFDHWLAESLSAGEVDALVDFQHKAPAHALAHPTTEHFAPLFVALGASVETLQSSQTVIEGFWFGLSKRSVRFD
ncbi:MAG: class III extradiol ring-cleavage dioxygenase [Actinomycetota bacterium]|nr:class III extradiol ring-cleavage dioxygenase [Actinomycetota bacterium]